MDEARKAKFEALLQETREDIDHIDAEIEKELAAVKERLAGLQAEKKAQLSIYGGYCQLLGISNDLVDEGDDDDE